MIARRIQIHSRVLTVNRNNSKPRRDPLAAILALFFLLLVLGWPHAWRSFADDRPGTRPWMDMTLSPERRAELVLKELTLDEKVALLHGNLAMAARALCSASHGWGFP